MKFTVTLPAVTMHYPEFTAPPIRRRNELPAPPHQSTIAWALANAEHIRHLVTAGAVSGGLPHHKPDAKIRPHKRQRHPWHRGRKLAVAAAPTAPAQEVAIQQVPVTPAPLPIAEPVERFSTVSTDTKTYLTESSAPLPEAPPAPTVPTSGGGGGAALEP